MSLDLEVGDEAMAEEAQSRQAARSASREKRKEPGVRAQAAEQRSENELSRRLEEAFGRIAEQLLIRGDDELGDAITEDKGKMAKGLVSGTRRIPFLRGPLTIALDLAEPFLAFFRVGRIVFTRAYGRIYGQQEEQYEQETADYNTPVAG